MGLMDGYEVSAYNIAAQSDSLNLNLYQFQYQCLSKKLCKSEWNYL